MVSSISIPLLIGVSLLSSLLDCHCQTLLQADGVTAAYTLITSTFGANALEMPDVNHPEFGPHVTQVQDPTLNRPVFAFHAHIPQDADLWGPTDRQRIEITTNGNPPPSHLVGLYGERITLSWNFKLDVGFQPPYSFCHIYQLKVVGGDDSMPIITLTTRKSNPNELQLLQYDSTGALLFLATTPLEPFLGEWVHAYADVTVGSNGTYFFQLTRIADGESMFMYSSNNIDFWREGARFMIPKWGLYRSKQEIALSRNETVFFDRICIGKGNLDRCM